MRALFTAPRIPKFTGWQYHWDYNGENIQSLRMDSTCGLCGLEESTADNKKVLSFFLKEFRKSRGGTE